MNESWVFQTIWYLILVFNANEIKIAEFIQESVFVRRNPCAEIESEFDIWIWKAHSLSIPFNRWVFECVKTALKCKNLKVVMICIPLFLAHLIIIYKASANVFTNF